MKTSDAAKEFGNEQGADGEGDDICTDYEDLLT